MLLRQSGDILQSDIYRERRRFMPGMGALRPAQPRECAERAGWPACLAAPTR